MTMASGFTSGFAGGHAQAFAGEAAAPPSAALVLLEGMDLNPRVEFSRSTPGTALSSAGETVTLAANLPRWQHDPLATTAGPLGLVNFIRNPRMEGAAPGTAGTLPTNFSVVGSSLGLSRTVVGTGVEDGVPFLEMRLSGTPSATGAFRLALEGSTTVAAAQGQAWTLAAFLRLTGGAVPAAGVPQLAMQPRDAGAAPLGSALAADMATPTGAALASQRSALSATIAPANTAALSLELRFPVQAGVPVDFTYRIGAPQLYNLAADPRGMVLPPIGQPGVWSAQRVVNHIPNPRGEGATLNVRADNQAAGTQVLPAGWAVAGTLRLTVTGQGVEDGLPFIDVALFSTGGTSAAIEFVGTAGVAAVAGEAYTLAAHVRPLTPLGTSEIQCGFFGAASDTQPIAFQPGTLAANRHAITATATAGSLRARLRIVPEAGRTFRLRIGAPALFRLPYDPGDTPLPPPGQQGRSGNLRLLGLLIEEARTNIAASIPSDNPAGWTQPGVTVTAPDGQPAAKLARDTQLFGFFDDTNMRWLAPVGGVANGANPFPVALRTDVFVRETLTVMVPADCALLRAYITRTDASNWTGRTFSVVSGQPYTFSFDAMLSGDGGMLVRNVQLERGAFATSPIPSNGDPVTREADVFRVPPAALRRLNLRRATFLARFRDLATTTEAKNRTIFAISDGTTANRVLAFIGNGTRDIGGRCTNGGVAYNPPSLLSAYRPGDWNNYGFAWGPGRVSHAVNGGAPVSNLAANPAPGARLTDGLRVFGPAGGSEPMTAVLARVSVQPSPLRLDQLQAATAL